MIFKEFGQYSYIGEFYCDSGMIEVCDPMACDAACSDIPVESANQTSVLVRNCYPGRYIAEYQLSDNGIPLSLIIRSPIISAHEVSSTIHKNAEPSEQAAYIGDLCCSLSNALCVIESACRNDSRFAMFPIEETAYYEPGALLAHMDTCPYTDGCKARLYSYLTNCAAGGTYAYGEKIMSITEDEDAYWEAYCSCDVASSHWAVDTVSRIAAPSPLPACSIHGGIVTRADDMLCKIYAYRGKNGIILALSIFFGAEEQQKTAVSVRKPHPADPARPHPVTNDMDISTDSGLNPGMHSGNCISFHAHTRSSIQTNT